MLQLFAVTIFVSYLLRNSLVNIRSTSVDIAFKSIWSIAFSLCISNVALFYHNLWLFFLLT